ncbi:hypothetical protein GCM10009117_26370 [Gangjinia marincola]|uniref:Phosphoadenosine phosphosulphate reductase domain-containing protein n=1 Tax=Gangjinia marincola TaxID=578463 RepID=A0ABN1MJU3_9FLAO
MLHLDELNERFRHQSPQEIIAFALSNAKRPILTTNFGPYAVTLVHAMHTQQKDIPVIWVKTGFNTKATLSHAQELIQKYDIDIKTYQSVIFPHHLTKLLGGIPKINTKQHSVFTEIIKLAPFRKALGDHQPDVWFTNLRKGKTAYRESIDIFSYNQEGILKVCPFYYFDEVDLEVYMNTHQLATEFDYYDPTKVLEHRECGIHL